MRLSSILLARTLAFLETADLNPRGKLSMHDIVFEIAKRFRFQQYPKTLEEFEKARKETGFEFVDGKIGSRIINKFTIWDSLLTVETRTDTNESTQITEEILLWGAEKLGLHYKPGMIRRWAYISDLSFYSDVPILDASPPLKKIADKSSAALTDIWQEPVRYEPIQLSAGHDPTSRKNGIAPFMITRRGEARFSENKYFSEAPLPTDVHIRLLEEFEADVKQMHEAR